MVQPVSIGISTLSVVVTGLAFVIARRQHLRDQAAMHQATEPAEAVTGITASPSDKPASGKDGVKAQAPAADMPPKRAELAEDKGKGDK
jgi:hypothetical protein